MMRDFQAVGASLDAASRDLSAATACSVIAPTEGFSFTLRYSNPEVFPEGKSPLAATHPGMTPLMAAMKRVMMTRVDFGAVIEQALKDIAAEVKVDAETFTNAVNAARSVQGLPLLVQADGDIEAAVTEAVKLTRQQLFEGEEQRFAERLRITREAELAQIPSQAGDPPPPRGARPGRR